MEKRPKGSWAWHWDYDKKRAARVQIGDYFDAVIKGRGRLVNIFTEEGSAKCEDELRLHDTAEDTENDYAERCRLAARQSFEEQWEALAEGRKKAGDE